MGNIYKRMNDVFCNMYIKDTFAAAQNCLAELVYKSLRDSYAHGADVVKVVGNLCQVLNNKEIEDLHIYSDKIHGKKSCVNFSMQGNIVCKELADMIVISIITENNEIVFEKTAFIQNKKENATDKWSIDEEQLFLLRNFPTFTGKTGIFRQCFQEKEIVFTNSTGSLGNYGLFKYPGEIIVATASEIYAKLKNKTIDHTRIIENSNIYNKNIFPHHSIEIGQELIVLYERQDAYYQSPFLRNHSLSINVYDFIRNLTQFNIGEPVININGTLKNKYLAEFNEFMINNSTFKDKIQIKQRFNQQFDGRTELEGEIYLVCVHLELK